MSRVEAGGPYSVWLSMMETFSAAIYKTGINPCVDVPMRVTRAFGRRGYVRVRATLVPVGEDTITFLKTPEARKRNVERVLEHRRRWGLLE